MALNFVSSVLSLTSTFSNARTNFSIVYSKRSILPTYGGTYTRGLSGGVHVELLGGVSGGRREVGGFGTISINAIISVVK